MLLRALLRRSFSDVSPIPALTSFHSDDVMLRAHVSAFAKEIIGPHVKWMDQHSQFHPDVLPALFQQGFMGIEVTGEYGGPGMNFTQSCIVVQEIAKVDPAVAVVVDIQNTLINASVRNFGSDAIKNKYLPKLTKDTVGSFCLSEAGSGSDAFALQTRAVYDAKTDTYKITGDKLWISNSKEAGIFIVFATIDPSAGYRGITAFVVERNTPGLSVGKSEDKLGIRASSTCPVNFDITVPSSAILGEVGKGYKIAIGLLNQGRVGIAAQLVGLAQGAFDLAMPYIHMRKQFGKPIADFQGMQFSYAKAATEIEAANLLMLNAARLCDEGKSCQKEAAMAKYYASVVAESVASQAIEWHGGIGFTKDCGAEKYYRDAKIGSIYEGTTNMQLQGIAKLIQNDYKNL